MKIFIFFFIFSSQVLIAAFQKIGPKMKLDLSSHREIIPPNCSMTPGEVCIWHCYKIINENTSEMYNCSFEATGYYKEKIITSSGDLFTGGRLIAKDFRSLIVYPYQNPEICFNFGKEIIKYPSQPSQRWVFTRANISADCGEGRRETRTYEGIRYF